MDLHAAADRQSNVCRLERWRIDMGVGAKSLAGTVVDALIASTLGMVFGVRRHHLDVGMNRESADMTENDEDRHCDEQLEPDTPSFHPGKR
jgi:hypothetical protein